MPENLGYTTEPTAWHRYQGHSHAEWYLCLSQKRNINENWRIWTLSSHWENPVNPEGVGNYEARLSGTLFLTKYNQVI